MTEDLHEQPAAKMQRRAYPDERWRKPLVSVVVPALNEEAIVRPHLEAIRDHMRGLEGSFDWELIFINDGSSDRTGALAEDFGKDLRNFYFIEHPARLGLGNALRSGINLSHGDYVLTLDIDLSYDLEHLTRLLSVIRKSHAKIAIASPYAKGGTTENIPFFRKTLSRFANRFLAFSAPGRLTTLTGLVRAYDGPFIRALNLKSQGPEVNAEIIYKAAVLRALMVEIPACLKWNKDVARPRGRMNVFSTIALVLFSGFLFRPLFYFWAPGVILLLVSAYASGWALIHSSDRFAELTQFSNFFERISAAVADAYQFSPHSFVVGGLSFVLGLQFISLGVQSLQSKRYFEETFHLNSSIYRFMKCQEESFR